MEAGDLYCLACTKNLYSGVCSRNCYNKKFCLRCGQFTIGTSHQGSIYCEERIVKQATTNAKTIKLHKLKTKGELRRKSI